MDIERLRALEKEIRDEADADIAESCNPELAEWVRDKALARGSAKRSCANRIANLIAELGQEVGAVAFEPTPMKEGPFGQEVAFRMGAYYYAFGATGIAIIDTILSAVACAGKAYHHTECWNDESDPYHDRLRGNSPSAWIQHAADDAASAIRKITSPAHTSEARDAARYRWLAENASIRWPGALHNGDDPASTRLPLDNAIDAAMRQEGGNV